MLEGPEKWSYLHWGRGVQTQPSILEETHGQHLKKDLGRLVSWYGPVLETDFPNGAESVYKRIKTAGRGAEAKFQNGQPGSEMVATQNPANSCCLLCTYYMPGNTLKSNGSTRLVMKNSSHRPTLYFLFSTNNHFQLLYPHFFSFLYL